MAEIQARPAHRETLYFGLNAPEVFGPAFTLGVDGL